MRKGICSSPWISDYVSLLLPSTDTSLCQALKELLSMPLILSSVFKFMLTWIHQFLGCSLQGQELDWMSPAGPFPLRIFCDSVEGRSLRIAHGRVRQPWLLRACATASSESPPQNLSESRSDQSRAGISFFSEIPTFQPLALSPCPSEKSLALSSASSHESGSNKFPCAGNLNPLLQSQLTLTLLVHSVLQPIDLLVALCWTFSWKSISCSGSPKLDTWPH